MDLSSLGALRALVATDGGATCEPTGSLYATDSLGLGVFLLIGLLGGAHCLGMCGPLVGTYADRMRSAEAGGRDGRDDLTVRQVRQHALFNLGRTASYATLGGLFGLAGSLAFVTGRTVTTLADDVHALTGIAVGGVIVALGARYALRLEFESLPIPGFDRAAAAVSDRIVARVDAWVGDWRILGLGAAHGFLPCPLLYPAFLYAFVQGSALGGAVSLGVLGLGTVPALLLFGTAFQSMRLETRLRFHRVLGVAFVALGYLPLQHGLATLGVPLPHPPIPYYTPF
ncbi:sulfite exporter TauE/SafE family protein [Halorubrum ezzemoulense]|jgi:sulfite exporter TauE/SafE|uniref:Urease accessory protein UreH-like transmembrane domain-containing protein n=1 Tax=Halorubrum ezzemoulense TaxID=337243 RepID=A0A256JCY9_HALEZ|nr:MULTISPECIES: sulfite exporter TauE/SafE family protein [Halorubrum]MDB2237482.1 sulfite exporter TauE/SafE family protein [Halorubrum ezzemoulense]MDB2249024.1 sulfite exporter TauE/SafE family protein [Halorubrum ezzemoulense]MDB9249947.1 sulfite exporter TauE/SafE family protein [Halorubrum ezzemoulense]MDB9250921.1 sulfite exporter TauE/SafE family protein [Halorubrum ezzemoulense]MDB9255330.1 sulfite exporter TauE/SafE family protein [Halorubrum ezzemoulense]